MSEARGQPRARSRGRRKTSRAVRIADTLAGLGIRLAGLGTIGAVSLVCVFLVSVAAPLFRSQRIERTADIPSPGLSGSIRQLALDDYETIAWSYGADARIRVLDLADGSTLEELAPFAEGRPMAAAIEGRSGRAAFGFADGTIRLAKLSFAVSFEKVGADTPPELSGLAIGKRAATLSGVAERISRDQLRVVRFTHEVDAAVALGDGSVPSSSVVLLDQSMSPSGPTLAGLTSDCRLWVRRVYQRTNWMTGEQINELSGSSAMMERCLADGLPDHLMLSGAGDNVFLVWRSGVLARIDVGSSQTMRVAEQLNVLDGSEAEPRAAAGAGKPHITATGFLIGRKTLVIGDSAGVVHTWFRAKPEGATTVDGALLVQAGRFAGPRSAVTALSSSSRSRALAIGFADGSLRVVHVTSGNLIGSFDGGAQTSRGNAISAIAIAPKDDAVFAVSTGLSKWSISPGYPEVNVRTLLRPVWYEGYAAPTHVWQSSSGSDEFEPKLGLVPLVFGTIKATVYSIFFGAPLALLAAIYTSEFLHPHVRARLKPTIELMASLPSVVLGFLAAIVFAPLVENVVPEIITAVVVLPFVLLLGAHVAQALPQRWAVRVRKARLIFAGACLPLALGVGFALGPAVERALFAGNFKLWLDGTIGGSAGAWAILVLPAAALAVALCLQRLTGRVAGAAARLAPASFLLARFLTGSVATLVLAFAAGFALDMVGLDVRGGVMGTYVQRNAMIVGFVMGFAIIPIIYTISEDALSSVPEHLRAGSLALGATRWQTAVRIVVPTAMSGLFSALMIGLGRAVGETMIVLMAAGNTPVLDWNIFNGLRTLSANIAVELPEAVRNSTHYRTLFLAALVLFAMTFTLNTAAEIIRLRFRKRAYQL